MSLDLLLRVTIFVHLAKNELITWCSQYPIIGRFYPVMFADDFPLALILVSLEISFRFYCRSQIQLLLVGLYHLLARLDNFWILAAHGLIILFNFLHHFMIFFKSAVVGTCVVHIAQRIRLQPLPLILLWNLRLDFLMLTLRILIIKFMSFNIVLHILLLLGAHRLWLVHIGLFWRWAILLVAFAVILYWI